MKIAIVGAGISGLTAAYELSKKNHQVTVFESQDKPGGLATYKKIGNNYLESFYHHTFYSDKNIIRLTRDLGIQDKLKFYPGRTGVYRKGRTYQFFSPLDLLRFSPLDLFNRWRCGITLGLLKFFPYPPKGLDKIPAFLWVKKYAGKEVYNQLWGPLLRSKFSTYFKKIPALWLWGRVRDRTLKLGYFDGSTKTFFDHLIKGIKKNGGKILLNTPVESIRWKKLVEIQTKKKTEKFDLVIVTTVSPITSKLLKSKVPARTKKLLDSQKHLGVICVILELKHRIQSEYWLNVCDPNEAVLVLIEHTNMIPPKHYGGSHILYLANYLPSSEASFRKKDEDLIDEYSNFLFKVNSKFKKSWIKKAHMIRASQAQTVFDLNSYNNRPPKKITDNVYMINIDQMYPHDRNLDQGVKLGIEIAKLVEKDAC